METNPATTKPAAARTPKLAVTALVDSTEQFTEPNTLTRLDMMEKAAEQAQGGLAISADVYRLGGSAFTRGLTSRIQRYLPMATLATGVTVGATVHGHLGFALALGLSLTSIAMTRLGLQDRGYRHQTAADKFRLLVPGPTWAGHRLYRYGVGSAPPTAADPCKHPSAQTVSDHLAESLQRYPSATHMVFVSGHGFGHFQMASLKFSEFAAALGNAQEKTGKGAGVLICDSCFMGNLEALSMLPDGVKVAVVSESPTTDVSEKTTTRPTAFLPYVLGVRPKADTVKLTPTFDLAAILPKLAASTASPQEMGRLILGEAAKQSDDHALVAVDLDQLRTKLRPALGSLGEHLQREIDGGKYQAVRTAARQATEVQSLGAFTDLGQFLDLLAEQDLSADTKQAAAQARQALNDSIIDKSCGGAHWKLSGMSFQRNANTVIDSDNRLLQWLLNTKRMGRWKQAPLADGWRGFIEKYSNFTPPK